MMGHEVEIFFKTYLETNLSGDRLFSLDLAEGFSVFSWYCESSHSVSRTFVQAFPLIYQAP